MFGSWRRKLTLGLIVVLSLCVLAFGTAYAATNVWPSVGASTVDVLRQIFGDQLVAQFEDLVLNTQDQAKQLAYKVTDKNQDPTGIVTPDPVTNNTPTPLPAGDWEPPVAKALGGKKNEAIWTPLLSVNNKPVVYRTYISPDPQRPYTTAVFVAFDVNSTLLHFVLGTDEPKSTVSIPRSGRIPASDFQPNILLAAFNGGFKTEHGDYGVMVNGVTVLPARDGMGAIGIYSDGSIKMGVLGKDIPLSKDLVAWRQNGPLIIQNGQINPLTNIDDPKNWGYIVGSHTATYRSGLALSKDGRTLYYVAGQDLTLPALASSFQAIGAYQAIQLDINNYWAHFDYFLTPSKYLQQIPLLSFMQDADGRFFSPYTRDFFYVTVRKQ